MDTGQGRQYHTAVENAAIACYTQYEGDGPRQNVGAQCVEGETSEEVAQAGRAWSTE